MTTKEAVSPAQIESQLAHLWDELQGAGKMRACLFNLVFYAKKDDRAGYLQLIAQTIIKRFPSRIISVLESTEKMEKPIEASVSVVEVQEGVFCDLIEIVVCPKCHDRVPFLVLPHLLPDLPIYLVWGCDPTSVDPISFKIESFATRTIFDSETSEDISAFSKSVLNHRNKTGCDISDLNWARLESWRALFASLFYNLKLRERLKGAEHIEIAYNGRATSYFCHTKTQAIYLSIWIATVIGWNYSKFENDTLIFTNGPKIKLVSNTHDELPPGRIMGVDIDFDGVNKMRLHRKTEHPHHVMIEECEKDACKILNHVVFERESSGTSMVNEVCHTTTSPHFLSVITALAQMNIGVA